MPSFLFVSSPVDTSLKPSHGHSGEAQILPEDTEKEKFNVMLAWRLRQKRKIKIRGGKEQGEYKTEKLTHMQYEIISNSG